MNDAWRGDDSARDHEPERLFEPGDGYEDFTTDQLERLAAIRARGARSRIELDIDAGDRAECKLFAGCGTFIGRQFG